MNWQVTENRLCKEYKLSSFTDIVKRLKTLTEEADALNHHPDLEIFNYNQIRFRLFTNDTDSITQKDYQLAEVIDRLFSK